jgi:hypothetical protein
VQEPQKQDQAETPDAVEQVTRWGLVVLAALAALGALLRIFTPDRLDQTTLLYLAVAGGLLLLRQIKTFSLGELKLEMLEKLRERQANQEERIADISLILPLLLADKEVRHVRNLFLKQTEQYVGSGALRQELRRLRSIGLIANKHDRAIGGMRDGTTSDLAGFVELTDLGKRWAARIEEIHATDAQP